MDKTSKHIPITQWAIDDRPREKAMLKGLESLSDAELIAILIGNGTTNKSALDVAQELLNNCKKDLDILARKSIKELSKITKGIGPVKATTILVALELGRRKSQSKTNNTKQYKRWTDYVELMKPLLEDKPIEEFYAMFFKRNATLIGYEKISMGGIHATVVDVKIIMKRCVDHGASQLAIAHNHPSGSMEPSFQDIQLTQRIKDACKIFDILFTDHIIITNNGYYSFAENANLT
jgi:DNA repair protein RadC